MTITGRFGLFDGEDMMTFACAIGNRLGLNRKVLRIKNPDSLVSNGASC